MGLIDVQEKAQLCKAIAKKSRCAYSGVIRDGGEASNLACELRGCLFKISEAERVILLDRLESGGFAPAAIGQKLRGSKPVDVPA